MLLRSKQISRTAQIEIHFGQCKPVSRRRKRIEARTGLFRNRFVYHQAAKSSEPPTAHATSQLAFPQDVCEQVYATEGYKQSLTNLAQSSLDSDMVFSDDGAVHQLATMTGSPGNGFTATLTVPV